MNQKIKTPGMANIFWMPIQTRTEMLTTGFRSVLGVKVFGPDLGKIQDIGVQIEKTLSDFPNTRWLDVAQMRVNHDGVKMDTLRGDDREKGDVPKITATIGDVHGHGIGVIGMKIMGEGRFTEPEQRDASIKFVMNLGTVDAVTIGYKSTAEIDEAIDRINTHLNA